MLQKSKRPAHPELVKRVPGIVCTSIIRRSNVGRSSMAPHAVNCHPEQHLPRHRADFVPFAEISRRDDNLLGGDRLQQKSHDLVDRVLLARSAARASWLNTSVPHHVGSPIA